MALGSVVGLALVTGLAGQLAAVVTNRGWPSWEALGLDLLRPIIDVYVHPDDPMRGWPGIKDEPPPAPFYWLFYVALLAAAIHLGLAARQLPRLRREQRSMALENQLGVLALHHRAPRLRPQMARTTPRPDPRFLGSSLGRDVSTGVACYASIAESKLILDHGGEATEYLLIPEVLDHRGPLVVISAHVNVVAATMKARANRGTVRLFDPLQDCAALPLLRWNPVDGCANPAVALRRARALMAAPPPLEVPVALLRNLLHAAALTAKPITQVTAWAHDHSCAEPAHILESHRATPASWAALQHRIIALAEADRAHHYAHVQAALAAFEHPSVLDSCLPAPGQQFDPTALTRASAEDTTVYVLAPPDSAAPVTGLTSALLDHLITITRVQPQRGLTVVEPPLRIVVDDGPRTVALPQLATALRHARHGIPATVVTTDRDTAAALWDAADVRVLMRPEDPEAAPRACRDAPTYRGRLSPTPAQALVYTRQLQRPVRIRMQPYHARDDAEDVKASERAFIAALQRHRRLL